jgi:hypothetical protein
MYNWPMLGLQSVQTFFSAITFALTLLLLLLLLPMLLLYYRCTTGRCLAFSPCRHSSAPSHLR